jgi:putative ABC transport system permease protein
MNTQWMIRDLWDGMRSQPGRILLAFLAISIGVMSLTLLTASLLGLQHKSRLIVRELGADTVVLLPVGQEDRQGRGVHARQVQILRDSLPHHRISATQQYHVQMPDLKGALSVIAVDEHLRAARPWPLREGRLLDAVDVREKRHVCLISRELALKQNLSLHQFLRLPPVRFEVVGILESQGDVLEEAHGDSRLSYGDNVLMVPLGVLPVWSRRRAPPTGCVDAVFIKCPVSMPPGKTVARVKQLLAPESQNTGPVSYITPATLIRGVRRLQRVLQLTTGSISLLCLLLGGTTLMSLMIANVRERISEIGLRLTLGASEFDIYALFVLEAILTTVLAAVAGSLAGHVVLAVIRRHAILPTQEGWATVLIPGGAAILVGMVFSYWPARSAARIMPSEALRND